MSKPTWTAGQVTIKGYAVGEYGIGQAVPRFEDPRLIRGEGRYVGDIALPGTAFGYVQRSPHAHARIRSIDTVRAKAGSGRAGGAHRGRLAGFRFRRSARPGGLKRRDGRPDVPAALSGAGQGRVRWVGDYVAFVVAETMHQAMDAAELIEVDYERCPPSSRRPTLRLPARPSSSTIAPTTSAFVQLFGDKAATDAAFAQAAQRRQASSCDQPRYCGEHGAARALASTMRADQRYTSYSSCSARSPSARTSPRPC